MANTILAFAGSTRTDSFNKKLIHYAARVAKDDGIEMTVIDLRDFEMPLYDGDLEDADGIPDNAMKLRELMQSHAGFLISCPEYNSSISGVLKNTIDWASRPIEGEAPLLCFKNKVVSLMSASPGGFGGLRGLVHVRSILGNIGSIVLPDQIAINSAHEQFDVEGNLTNENFQGSVKNIVVSLNDIVSKVHG